MKKIGIIFALMTLLVGCGNGKASLTTTVCSVSDTSYGIEVVNTLTSKADELQKIVTETSIEAPSKEELDDSMDLFNTIAAQISEFEGVQAKFERPSDTLVKQVLEIDFLKADLEELSTQNIFTVETADKKVSLKTVVENLEASGFTCKTNN